MSDTAESSSEIYFATDPDGTVRPMTEEERRIIDKYRLELRFKTPAQVSNPVPDHRFPRKPWRPGG